RALAVADRRGVSPELWRVFNATGTGHLLAISGLHIGLVAGLGGLIGALIWRRSANLCRTVPPRVAGAGLGMVLAAGYALLAGLGLPTQRALLMTGVAALAVLTRRDWRVMDVFLWAVAVVLIADPMAPLGAGFWLSFWAVAVLILAAASSGRGVGHWAGAQLAVSCGLFPLLGLWFGELPWISPLANAVAVPLVSFLVVPLVLLGLAGLAVGEAVGGLALWAAATVLEFLVAVLGWTADRAATWSLPQLPPWTLAAGALGTVLAIAPGRWPGRGLAVTLLVPLFLYRPAPLSEGTARVTFADVGQGTGVVVETRHHVLVYDAGPRLGRTDAAAAALLPLLRHRGHDRIDRLVISHADADHAGGLSSLLEADLAIGSITAGEPLEDVSAGRCAAGQAWSWDGVAFRVLHPGGAASGNDASCVIQIRAAGGATVLLAGDISRSTEGELLSRYGESMRSDLLLVPHHGSGSSSAPRFVQAVSPREAVFTVGYRNRYGLPDDRVRQRYLMHGAAVRETARTGALTYRLDRRPRVVGEHRRDGARYFHDR
ncbi:DNA internalization-related competence protein ComEC/Rec2, partial [Ectothiorhodospiraceae bacterium WFHF3C12]|nr:DNA internalization-related competence protein ComEC/Rec2 [Ectothiorhodospiraceae bacterium WFHF3C12]